MDVLFPLDQKDNENGSICLLSDDTGIPKCAADRLRVFDNIMVKAKEYGISPDRMHIDPFVEMLCTSEDGSSKECGSDFSTIRENIRTFTLSKGRSQSNISFNLPVRKCDGESKASLRFLQ